MDGRATAFEVTLFCAFWVGPNILTSFFGIPTEQMGGQALGPKSILIVCLGRCFTAAPEHLSSFLAHRTRTVYKMIIESLGRLFSHCAFKTGSIFGAYITFL